MECMNIKRWVQNTFGMKEFVNSAVMNKLDIFGSWQGEVDPAELVKKVKGWSYSCINKNATCASQVPLRLYKIQHVGVVDDQKHKTTPIIGSKRKRFLLSKMSEKISQGDSLTEVTEHPILDLIRNVNPFQNGFELKYLTFSSLEVTGNAYWYLSRGALGINEIWPLFAHRMTVVQDEMIGVKEYKYGSGIKKRTFTPDEIVHFKYPSLTDALLGTGPTQQGCQPIDLMDYYNRYEIACLKNGGMPSVVMTMGENAFIAPEERKRIESKWKTSYSGPDKQGKLLVGSPGIDIKEIGFSPKEMSYSKGREAALEEICGVYGIPMSFVKVQEVSRANAWASLYLYAQQTINPKLILVEQKLNEHFTSIWDKDLVLLFDDATPVDRDFRLLEKRTNIETKYSSINEERERDGLDPVAWGVEPKEEASPFGMSSPGADEEDADPKEDEKKAVTKLKDPTPSLRNDLPKRDFMPVVMLTQVNIFFKQLVSDVTKELNKIDMKSYHGKAIPSDVVSAVFNSKKFTERLEKTIMPFIKGIMQHSAIEAMEKLNPKAFYNASSPAVGRALKRRNGEIKTIIGTTESEMRKHIAAGIDAGKSTSEIVKTIRDEFDTRYFASRVVRSETIWAHNEGTQQGWVESKVVTAKVWDTASDERLCPYCEEMNGKQVDLTESFIKQGESLDVEGGQSMDFGYGDVDHPPLHPNCRCNLLPVIVGEEEIPIQATPTSAANELKDSMER